jgi:hypothetical protein
MSTSVNRFKRWRNRTALVLVGCAALAASTLNGMLAPTPIAAAAPAGPIYWGAYIAGAPWNTALLDTFEQRSGKKMSIVHWGQPWKTGGAFTTFPTSVAQTVRGRGSIPMINWGSWELGYGVNQPSYRLANIANGAFDTYITQFAQGARAWGHPVLLRFDHEMNGWWQFPWAEQVNGNQPGDFVRMWRHVHDIFVQQGASNVTWVWCPNISSARTTPYSELYPGDDYVDWTCFDGYNFGTDDGNQWQSFGQLLSGGSFNAYHNSYQEMLAAAPSKPMMIGETASSEHGGSKATWLTDMLATQLPINYPNIKALVYFNWNAGDPNISWPIESSAASQAAWAQGLASPYYASNQFGSISGKVQPPASAAAPAPTPTTPPTVTPTTPPTPSPAPTNTPTSLTRTVSLTPVADTFIASSSPSSTAGGASATLRSDYPGTDTTFLRFDLTSLAGRTITAARLRVHSSAEAWAGSKGTFDIKYVVQNDWKEQWMSYANTVAISNTVLGNLVSPSSPNTWYQVNLNVGPVQQRAGSLISMAISGRIGDVLIINSRQSTAPPRLELTYK